MVAHPHRARGLRMMLLAALLAAGCATGGTTAARAAGADAAGADTARAYSAPDHPLTAHAERYVRLVLAVGEHDDGYVDAYYGPDEWREEVGANPPSLDRIEAEAARVLDGIRALDVSSAPGIVQLRKKYLTRQLEALAAYVRILGGEELAFDDESRALYDAVAPAYPESHYRALLDSLDAVLPGTGSVAGRLDAYRRDFIIPKERLDTVFRVAIAEARRRTAAHLRLPQDERFRLEYVTGKAWSGYNWYQGGNSSLIQINTDLPISIDRAIDLGAHEGYPGHHVYNVLLEENLVRGRGWPEYSVYALYSPQSLIAEGSANYGIDVAFPGGERVVFERDVLFPLAGLDPARAEEYGRVRSLVDRLGYAGNEAARAYLDGEISADSAAKWLNTYALMEPARAEQRVRFIETYRSYVINYNHGRDLVARYVESRGGTADRPERRWAVFSELLSSPMLPADLRVAADDDRLTGEWEGGIELPGLELRVELRFTRADGGDYAGTISIPQQNARDVPLSDVRAVGDSATFSIPGVPGTPTFAGMFSGDTILAGTFRQGGQSFPFRVRRTSAPDSAMQAGSDPSSDASDTSGGARAASATDPLSGLDERIEQALDEFRVPGLAIGIVHRGQVVYSRGFGERDIEARLPVTPRTLFAIGSATKAFTAFALGQQVDAGRLEWDAPARQYVPELQLWDDVATLRLSVRDMLAHRSGLPRHDFLWYGNRTITPGQLLERLPHLEPSRQLREQWQYNNLMYVLAGHLLARVAGAGVWNEVVREEIFDPLGMTASTFTVTEMQRSPDHALPYREDADTLVRVPFRHIDAAGPAGSVNSSIEDMLKWVAVHLADGAARDGERLIRPATLREMHSPQAVIPGMPTDRELSPASYGLGWMIATYRGRYRVQHGGAIDGFSALVTLYPRDQLGIVVLTNRHATPLPALVTDHAADRLLELPARDWLAEGHRRLVAARTQQADAAERAGADRKSGTRPAFPLSEYAGDYTHPGYGTIRIAAEGEGLVLRYNELEAPFEHWHYEVFRGPENALDPTFSNTMLQFSSDTRGRVDAASILLEPSLAPIRFERAPDAELRDPAYLRRLAGRYRLEAGGVLEVRLQGDRLVLDVPGQPPYTLAADRHSEFVFTDISGYRVRSIRDADDGGVAELHIVQPNGTFVARPAS